MTPIKSLAAGLGLTVLLTVNVAQAGPFSNLFVFGDSFSDTGNVLAGTFGLIPPPPYFNGRFSDGPVWVERLAELLELSVVPNGADPFTIVGNNFSAGGAWAAQDIVVPPFGTLPSVRTQTQAFIDGAAQIPADALYIVFGGHNDLRAAVNPANGLNLDQQAQIAITAGTAIIESVVALAQAGAKTILVPNIADLGITPEARFVRNNAAASTGIAQLFNAVITPAVDVIQENLPVNVVLFDTFTVSQLVALDAVFNGGQLSGITNIDEPIFPGFAGSDGADPTVSMWSDDLHLSSLGHRRLGEAIFLTLVPEPSTAMILAVCTTAALRTRRKNLPRVAKKPDSPHNLA